MSDSESKRLEKTRVALTNAKTHPEINPILADFGVDETKLAEGETIYNTALAKWEQNKKEEAEKTIASNEFQTKFNELQATYKKHKNFAQRIFRRTPAVLIQLGLEGRYPSKYDEVLNKIKLFYTTISTNTEIQTAFARIKITPELVTECLANLDNVLALRAAYEKEYGEAQDATDIKNEAMAIMDEWKEDFDDIANIALYDKPQLLEVLGIFVRS